jgi:predicted negative regulator of RcsB-dependent stress response
VFESPQGRVPDSSSVWRRDCAAGYRSGPFLQPLHELMTKTGEAARPALEDRADSIWIWLETHSRQMMYVALAVLAVAGGIWFYQKSKATQASNASVALAEAQQSVEAGNLPLAQTSLEKLVGRYEGTPAARQASLLLADVQYQQGHYDQGIATLRKLIATGDKYSIPGAYNLIGAGLEQEGKPADAAVEYQKAANASVTSSDKDSYLANAARALTVAGKNQEARAIWTKLAGDDASPYATEAKVRLGELEVRSASKS